MIIILRLWIGFGTFIISFYASNISKLFVLHPWIWSHEWPKHVRFYCVYKLNSIHLFAFVGIIVRRVRKIAKSVY